MKKSFLISIIISLAPLLFAGDFLIYPSVTNVSFPCQTGNGCPGSYCYYLNYTNAPNGAWGWKLDTNVSTHTITDTNHNNTKIQWGNDFGFSACNQRTVMVPSGTPGTYYRFAQYGTNAVPSTNSLLLHGFLP